jgi:hypothetical protein
MVAAKIVHFADVQGFHHRLLSANSSPLDSTLFMSLILGMEIEEVYHDVKQIHYSHRIAEANAYLELGWRLLKVLAKRDKDEYAGFVLGWPHDRLAQHPKDDFSDSAP